VYLPKGGVEALLLPELVFGDHRKAGQVLEGLQVQTQPLPLLPEKGAFPVQPLHLRLQAPELQFLQLVPGKGLHLRLEVSGHLYLRLVDYNYKLGGAMMSSLNMVVHSGHSLVQ